MKAKLLTMDYNLGENGGVPWGGVVECHSFGEGAESRDFNWHACECRAGACGQGCGQAIGYLPDGSMLVVNGGSSQIGHEVRVEVDSVVPSAGGKMIFATYRPSIVECVS